MSDNKYVSENIRIRKILQDLVENAYKGKIPDEKMDACKKFWFEFSDKELRSRAGCYMRDKKKININSIGSRDTKHVLVTCIHEVCHHLEYEFRGDSGHGKEFYEIYEILLHTALNMRLFEPKDVESLNDVTARNKVKTMVEKWAPEYISYRDDEIEIQVSNSFSIKEHLKEHGYKYNGQNQAWGKVIPKSAVENEKNWLITKLSVQPENIVLSDKFKDAQISLEYRVVVSGNTYEIKDILKANGFRFTQKKEWESKPLHSNDDCKNLIANLGISTENIKVVIRKS